MLTRTAKLFMFVFMAGALVEGSLLVSAQTSGDAAGTGVHPVIDNRLPRSGRPGVGNTARSSTAAQESAIAPTSTSSPSAFRWASPSAARFVQAS